MKITVMGCGSSPGTPAAGGFWGACDPKEPRNERTRASLLVQSDTTNIVVDTSYDLRIHLNRLALQKIDGVLLTHAHSDHINGIEDLRLISFHHRKLIDVYSNKETLDEVERRWPYMFFTKPDSLYTQFVRRNDVDTNSSFQVGDIKIDSFAQDHTVCTSLGFRFGNFAYSVDVADLDENSLNRLKGIDIWLVDAASYHNESVLTHANLKRVMKWVDRIKPKMTYLTVLSNQMDYQTLCNELPPHIRPAHDGMQIDTAGNLR